MPTRDEMTIDERRKYVNLMCERYRKAKRKERSQLLSEMEQVSKLHRKHLIRLLNGESLQRKKRSTPRSRTYGPEVERVVLRVWESLDYLCAERLTPSLGRMAKHLASFGSLVLTTEVEGQKAPISPATVERMLRKNRARKERLPRTGPHRANQVTKGVPMGRIPWDTSDPGHFETDLVHHGGESAAGEYGHTLQLIDVATGWSECVMLLGRGYQAMEAAGNALYERMWLYYNLFQPVMHLTEKTVEGDKVRRKWDEAQTPYQRLLATGVLSPEQQERLQALYEQTNPLLLREEIYRGLAALWDGALAQSGTAA